MFIRNPDIFPNSYRCHKLISLWLIKNNILPFGADREWYYFTYNCELKLLLRKLPLWLKIINKGGVIGEGCCKV